MTEWAIRERGTQYTIAEHTGTVEHIQSIARTNVRSTSQGAGLFTSERLELDVSTAMTQRVFMTGSDGSKWSFDCEDNIPVRPGSTLAVRYLSTRKQPPAVACLADYESNWDAIRPHIVERFVRPRWRSLITIVVAALVALFVFVHLSNAEVRQFYQQAYPPGTGVCLGRDVDLYGQPLDGPNGRACRQVVALASYGLSVAFIGLWLVWFLRRRSLRLGLYRHLKQPGA
jgi:hypothetical protein